MRTKDLETLPTGSYVSVQFVDGNAEVAKLRGVRGPTERELHFGSTSNRIEVRRYLLGGYVDTWVYPRDVKAEAEPDEALLGAMDFIETEVGPKPVTP